MRHIPGENLCDLLNRRCLIEYADKLARWVRILPPPLQAPRWNHPAQGDSNLRNFILRKDGSLFGVDFEETAWGDPSRDIGQICASILDTEPMFTPAKAALCRRLIARYGEIAGQESLEYRIVSQIARALRETAQRRPRQRRYLVKQAGLLEQHGLDYFLLST